MLNRFILQIILTNINQINIMSIKKTALLLAAYFVLNHGGGFAQKISYTGKVNTLIGNHGKGVSAQEAYLEAGCTFPGAMYPFGMTQFTPSFFVPDNGFVINQMSGAGCEHMGNLPLLPLAGGLTSSPKDMLGFKPGFKVENASAGFYQVLSKDGINSALTVTQRTGMGQFTFLSGMNSGTIIIGTGLNGTSMKEAQVKITSASSFEGFADGGSFCGTPVNYRVYFVASFDTNAITLNGTWISWDDFKKGARLSFNLSDQPNKTWGTAVAPHLITKISIHNEHYTSNVSQ